MRYLLFILIISTSLVWASDNPLADLLAEVPYEQTLTDIQLKSIENELRLQSMIIESVEKIRIDGGTFVNINQATSATRDIILQTSLTHYVFRDEIQKTRFTEAVKNIFTPPIIKNNLLALVELTKRFSLWQANTLVSTARTQGLIYSLVKFISIQLDTTVPLLVIGSGNVAVGVGMLFTPISPVSILPFKLIKDTVKHLALTKRLGLAEARNQYQLNKYVADLYNKGLMQQLNLVNAHFDEKQYIVSYQKDSWLRSKIKGSRYSSELTLNNMFNFIEDYPQYEEFANALKRSRATEEIKLLTLLTSIENHADSQITHAFLERFERHIHQTENIDIPRRHRSWIKRVANAKNFEEFYHYIRKIPEDFHPRILEKVWRDYIFPNLSENLSNKTSIQVFKVFRQINADFEAKISPSLIPERNYFTGEQRSLFITTIFESMAAIGPCEFIYRHGALAP